MGKINQGSANHDLLPCLLVNVIGESRCQSNLSQVHAPGRCWNDSLFLEPQSLHENGGVYVFANGTTDLCD